MSFKEPVSILRHYREFIIFGQQGKMDECVETSRVKHLYNY
jgi:hypothetical protein